MEDHIGAGTIGNSFSIRIISTTGGLSEQGGYTKALFQGEREWTSASGTALGKFRPIITLFSDVLINSGEGTKDSPYLLSK